METSGPDGIEKAIANLTETDRKRVEEDGKRAGEFRRETKERNERFEKRAEKNRQNRRSLGKRGDYVGEPFHRSFENDRVSGDVESDEVERRVLMDLLTKWVGGLVPNVQTQRRRYAVRRSALLGWLFSDFPSNDCGSCITFDSYRQ